MVETRLLVLQQVRLGQRLDRAQRACGAVARQRHAPEAARPDHAAERKVGQAERIKAPGARGRRLQRSA